jgi:hypothetical protein
MDTFFPSGGSMPVPEWMQEVKCHSFLPETGVLMEDGSTKAIQDVEPGDKVLSTDPRTGKSQPRTVLASIATEDDKEFADLTVTTDQGEASIIATTNHPFWVPDLKQWINAGDITPGQWLRTASGTWVQVSAVTTYIRQQRTHDLTVDTDHTYYVLAGDAPVLVHNCTKKEVEKVRASLEGKHVTTGVPTNAFGIPIGPDISSGEGAAYDRVNVILRGITGRGRNATWSAASHAEPKIALWMNDSDVEFANVVINQWYVCGGEVGGAGCINIIPRNPRTRPDHGHLVPQQRRSPNKK